MTGIDHAWRIKERNRSANFIGWCHNPDCGQYGKTVERDGWYEYDTGVGDMYDNECRECGEVLFSYAPPDRIPCDRCGKLLHPDDARGDGIHELCENCYDDLYMEWNHNKEAYK